MKRRSGLVVMPVIALLAIGAQDKPRRAAVDEESRDYYRRWLEEDVLWIISEEEREVLLSLTTDDERDAFIEQFWARRDPDPSTLENELKLEHYRRIVYANENYTAGIDGWKTDRGMIYIKFGPPDRYESFPGGGTYARERKEGGGMTTVFPFERWEYRHIEGIGDDVQLEFVDDKGGGLYELTWDKQRKDALLYSGRMGLTQDEIDHQRLTGTVNKRERILGRREAGDLTGIHSGAGAFETSRDKPFAQLETSAGLARGPIIRFKDLEALITTRISYRDLPFEVRTDFIRITDQQILVPISVLVPNAHMTFKQAAGTFQATVQVFGRVVGLGNRIEAVFEDEVGRVVPAEAIESSRRQSSIHQKRLILKPGLYKLDLAVRDPASGRIGTSEQRLEVPGFGDGRLGVSSLVLADRIEPGTRDLSASSFLLGDLKVVPRTDDTFRRAASLGLYFQIYNFAVDQQTGRPALKIEYGVAANSATPSSWRDVSPSLHYAGRYCRLARMVSLNRVNPGRHTIHVRVRDTISGQTTSAQAAFTVVE